MEVGDGGPGVVDVSVGLGAGVGVGGRTVNLGVGGPGVGEAAVRDGVGLAVVGATDSGAARGTTLLDGGVLAAGGSPGVVAPASSFAGALAEPGELLAPEAACRWPSAWRLTWAATWAWAWRSAGGT